MVRPGAGFRHEALFYRGTVDLVEQAVPFLREGVRDREPMLVVLPAEKNDAVRRALGRDADAVTFADMAAVGANPARIMPAWRWFVDAHAGTGRTLRGIGEPIGPHRTGPVLDECHRHEALLNVAFADAEAFELLCPYDVDALDPDVTETALRTHPLVHGGEPSDHYTPIDPREPLRMSLSEPTVPTRVLAFDSTTLAALRSLVRAEASASTISSRRVNDLVVAVNEIATNSLQHGGGSGELRIWRTDTSLVCEVRDAGMIREPLIGRVVPARTEDHARGHWIANQVCDLVQVSSSRAGTAVRLHMRREQ